jgi:hypothetical protein
MVRSVAMGDRIGIALAVVCAAHCVAAPVLAASLQLAGALGSESTELLFITSSLLISGMTIVTACAQGRCRLLAASAFLAGACCLIAPRLDLAWVEAVEHPLIVAGAGLIVVAHLVNLSNCRCDEEGATCAAAAEVPRRLPRV